MTHRTEMQTELDRMGCYQALAAAFSYPGPSLFRWWPEWAGDEQGITAEYDRLFRAGQVWLYGAEHLAQNEFQRAQMLSDIMGFYRAFGLEPDKERPDALACVLEFMQCLILKHARLADRQPEATVPQGATADPAGDKAEVCRQAQRTFFTEYVGPTAAQIGPQLRAQAQHPFYQQAADDLLAFLEAECDHLGVSMPQDRVPGEPGHESRGTGHESPALSSDQQDFCGDHCV